MNSFSAKRKGRGVWENPVNRFEKIDYQYDENDHRKKDTRFLKDTSKSIISYNTSPDISVNAFINPYRGCEHGCIYCYARPNHEYLGLSAGLDFETQIFVKENAPMLLRRELMSPKWKPQAIGISGVTDPYQPVEKKLELTRGCLKILTEFRNPIAIVTKNRLVTRDIDILSELVQYNAAIVIISITSLDADLIRIMEPRTSRPDLRLRTIRELSEHNIPTGVLIGPVIPGLTDHEIPQIIKRAAQAGARFARYIMLRLPFGLKGIFEQWLDMNLPDRKDKILNKVRSVRNGKLYDSTFFNRDRGEGILADQIEKLFNVSVNRAGISDENMDLSADYFKHPAGNQLSLF